MKTLALVLLALAASSAVAQMTVPAPGDAPVRRPADPGMGRPPANSGVVVEPPSTGTEEMVRKPPKNVDPKIDDATGDVDRRNRDLSQDKDKDKAREKPR